MTEALFYPTETSDSYVGRHGQTQTFADIRAGAGTFSSVSNAALVAALLTHGSVSDRWQQFTRAVVNFNTAGLPDDAIISAVTLSVCVTSIINARADSISLVATTASDPSSIVTADYAQFGTTLLSDTEHAIADLTVDSSTMTVWTLNSTGRAATKVDAYTQLGVRTKRDVDNSPAKWGAGEVDRVIFQSADTGLSADKRPTLTVTYSLPFPPRVIMF